MIRPILVALLIILIVYSIKNGGKSSSIAYILVGGLIFGFIGMFGGMLGAVLLFPSSNLAPIIGVLYTGPAGFIIGLVAGWSYWKYKKNATP